MADEKDLIPESISRSLLALADRYEQADWYNRDRIIRQCRKRENYWNGNQFLFWSDVAHDWRNPQDFLEENPQYTVDPNDYAKCVNIYAAHGEAIIAALSTGVPYTEFGPDDADLPEDIQTAKAFTSIAEILQKHNKVSWLNTRALHILYNQNYLAGYTYYHEDERYGVIKRPIMGSRMMNNRTYTCSQCGAELGGEQIDLDGEGTPPMECPTCGPITPYSTDTPEAISTIESYEDIPKGKQRIEIYGPTHVVIPSYSTSQESIPYLILKTEQHYAQLQKAYPDYADKIGPSGQIAIDRWARLPENYMDKTRADLTSVRQCWFRPWAYNLLGYDKEEVAELNTNFPNGCYCVIVGTVVVEVHDENLDEHWTIARSPTSNYLHAEALGQRLVPIQDMENDLDNLTYDTIRFGIPVTFFDPNILDSKKFQQSRAEPGLMYPTKPDLTGDISKKFYQTHTATLSKEVDAFGNKLTALAQFLLGAFPSIYGGQPEGGSQTASEYSMSRAQALQRLQLIWKVLVDFWPRVVEKAVRCYAKNLSEDESFAEKQGNSYINIWVRKSQLTGNVGLVEAEASESFPISWAQKRDILIQLMQYKDENLNAAIFHPENTSLIARIIGFPELYIPGDEDRTKQLSEIAELLSGEPIPTGMDPMTGQPMPPQASVMPEPIDNHPVHVATICAWCNGEVGQSIKKTNPAGYANVLAHHEAHIAMMPPPMPENEERESGAE